MSFADIRESAYMAFDTVRSNKLRSSLTILGVSVGVITVVFMVSIIQGLNKAFAAQIESLGSNTIWATKFDPSIGHQPTSEEIHRKELTIEDANAIRREAPSIVGVSPFYRKINETARYGDKQSDTPILIGVTPYHEFTTSSYGTFGQHPGSITRQHYLRTNYDVREVLPRHRIPGDHLGDYRSPSLARLCEVGNRRDD